MRAAKIVPGSSGWYVTEQGKLDLLTAPICACQPRLEGLLFTCRECGTVYGYLREDVGYVGRTKRRTD